MTDFAKISEALDRIVAAQQQPQAQQQVAGERPAAASAEDQFAAQIEAAQQKSGGWVSVPLDQTTDGGRF